jgi:two-component system, OmpR family, copper resistance phosphate regulon response regulator CusR
MNILVVEDETNVAEFIKEGLEENGFVVDHAADGETGVRLAAKNDYHLVILDIILPQMDGWDVCKNIRANLKKEMPILMLTALNSTDNVVKGLDLGADDYLPKPFKLRELLARVNALTRRYQKQSNGQPTILKFQDLVMNLDSKEVHRADKRLKLTSKEFNLLEYLMRNAGKVLSRMDILENVWGINFDLGTNVVDVYVNYLRNKVDKPFSVRLIHTVVGMGYVFKVEDDY